MVVVLHSIAAILVFLLSLLLHMKVKPFEFVYQNFIEIGLYLVDLLVVGGALLYTVLPNDRAESCSTDISIEVPAHSRAPEPHGVSSPAPRPGL